MRTFKENEVSFHTAVDNSDPGFQLKGHVLRWQSSHVAARKAGRIWDVLKVSQIPTKALEQIKTKQYRWFSKDGDTIRKGDLVLSYAPIELVQERRQKLRGDQMANEAMLRGKVNHGSEIVSTASSSREMIQDSAESFSK